MGGHVGRARGQARWSSTPGELKGPLSGPPFEISGPILKTSGPLFKISGPLPKVSGPLAKLAVHF